ncbi:MAG: FHA domain-containing protein [Pseudomonadota bacterium]
MPKLTLSFKGRLIDVFHINEGDTRIGRDPDCEISIDSLAIAPINVNIKFENHTCHLENLDDEFPVLINHKNQTASPLQHGDVIQVGKHTLSFSEDALELGAEILRKDSHSSPEMDDAESDAEDAAKGILQIMSGDKFGRIIPLSRNMTRIGRTGGHCAMIARRESGYYISYLEGPTPPIVNKAPIGEETQLLTDGDIIEVGATRMQFHT